MCALDIGALRQGDVLRGGRFFFQNDRLYSLKRYMKRGRPKFKVIPSSALRQRHQQSLVYSLESDLIVVTQSCDIRKGEQLIVSPVHPMVMPTTNDQWVPLDKGRMHLIRNQLLTNAYWLPARNGPIGHYPESYADVRVACTILMDVVASFTVVRTLDRVEREEFRKFLFNFFGRPAIEDEVVGAMHEITKVLRNDSFHPWVHSIWLDVVSHPMRLLVISHEVSPSHVDRLQKATSKANQANPTHLEFQVSCKLKASATFADVEGYTRIAFDNLSFGTPTSVSSTDLDV